MPKNINNLPLLAQEVFPDVIALDTKLIFLACVLRLSQALNCA